MHGLAGWTFLFRPAFSFVDPVAALCNIRQNERINMPNQTESVVIPSGPTFPMVSDPPQGLIGGAEGQVVYCAKTKDLWLKTTPPQIKIGWKRIAFFSEVQVSYS